MHDRNIVQVVCCGYGRGEGKGSPRNLLSDHVRIVIRLHLEGAVVGPEVDGGTDAGDTALIDLGGRQLHLLQYALVLPLTISAASVPPIENSRSAYLFQKP